MLSHPQQGMPVSPTGHFANGAPPAFGLQQVWVNDEHWLHGPLQSLLHEHEPVHVAASAASGAVIDMIAGIATAAPPIAARRIIVRRLCLGAPASAS